MSKTFGTILVPVDFSAHSTEALRYAATLADRLSSSVLVLHVIAKDLVTQAPHQDTGRGVPLLGLTSEALDLPTEVHEPVAVDLREQTQTALQHFLPAEFGGLQVERRVEVGHPVEQILETAKREQVDLMVMGTHGRTSLRHVVLGSVAERVMQMASCPVLMVKAPGPDADSEGGAIMPLETLSLHALRHLRVQDANGQVIGRITDAVVNQTTLSLRGFVVHGSRLEEALEALNLREDVDPLVTLADITGVTDRTLTVNQAAADLPNAAPQALAEDDRLFSDLNHIPVLDVNGQPLGLFVDVYVNADGTPAYCLGGQTFTLYVKHHHCADDILYVMTPDGIQRTEQGYQLQTDIPTLEREMKRSLTNLVRDLMVEAAKDREITADEHTLIDVVSVDLDTYQEALDDALADGVLSREEEHQLEALKGEMLSKVCMLARQDGAVTRDESALIRKFATYMVDHQEKLFWKVLGPLHRPFKR